MKSSGAPVLGMILKGYPRISETFISNEILLLEKLGFSVRLISLRHPREAFCHDSVRRIRARVDYLPQTIRQHLFRLLYANLRVVFQQPKAYGRAVATAWRRFRRTRKSATLKHLLQGGWVVHYLLPGSGITHLHAHFAHSPTSVAMFAAALSGLPFSFTAHAKDIYTSDPRQLKEKIEKAAFVVTCTRYNAAHLRSLAGKAATTTIHTVYHGIDLALFSRGGAAEVVKDKPLRILSIARMTAKKGLPTVYRALRLLRDREVDFRHTLIGDGDDRDEIRTLIEELGLTKHTRLAGTLPHDQVIDHFNHADLFMLGCEQAPNGDRDGIPNVFVESMAMGVPVVATRVSAIPELVQHEKTGLLVSPGKPEELADAVIRLISDTQLRDVIVEQAADFVAQHFDNTTLIRKLARIYTEKMNH